MKILSMIPVLISALVLALPALASALLPIPSVIASREQAVWEPEPYPCHIMQTKVAHG